MITGGALSELFAVLAVLGAVYCLGGLHGLFLAWTQPARMDRFARSVHNAAMRVVDAEDRKGML